MMSEQLHITADKRLRYASPKLPSATSFIRKPLYAMPCQKYNRSKIDITFKRVSI